MGLYTLPADKSLKKKQLSKKIPGVDGSLHLPADNSSKNKTIIKTLG